MFRAISLMIWSSVIILVLISWALKKAVITITPEAPEYIEPLWMGVSKAPCRHLHDIGRTLDYFECMGIGYVKAAPEPEQRD